MEEGDEGKEAAAWVRQEIGRALKQVREAANLTKVTLGARIGKPASYFTEWEKGRKGAQLDDIIRIEEALNLTRGSILRLAGFIDEPATVRDAIAGDPTIPESDRVVILEIYDGARKRAQREISSSPNGEER